MKEDLNLMSSVHSTVFKESENLEGQCIKIEGYDFNQGVNHSQLLKSMVSTGFQASNLGDAIEVVNQMVSFCFLKKKKKKIVVRILSLDLIVFELD